MQTKVVNKFINMREGDIYLKLETAMRNQRITWQVMADKLGVTRVGLSKTFKMQTLTISTMLAMCKVLNIDPVELFGEKMQKNVVNEDTPVYNTSNPILSRLAEIHALCNEIAALLQSGFAKLSGFLYDRRLYAESTTCDIYSNQAKNEIARICGLFNIEL